jgi:uncharacterized protein
MPPPQDIPAEGSAPLEFEWDVRKAAANEKKHGVTFAEAATAFGDPRSLTIYDDAHSSVEDRWILVGMSAGARLLSIAHTERGARIRIIAARDAGPRQRRAYEETEEDPT